MNNYTIADLNDECNVDATGVYRWVSSNNVVPGDILKDAGMSADALAINKVARDIQIKSSLRQYAQAQADRSPEQVAEQHASARAAFGPGVEVINALTGEKYTT